MVLLVEYPLSERQFNDALIKFNSSKVLFNYLTGTELGIVDSVAWMIQMANALLTEIDIYTAYLQACFARRLLSEFTTEDTLEYTRRLGSNTRFSKIYLGRNRGQDSPGALYGVR